LITWSSQVAVLAVADQARVAVVALAACAPAAQPSPRRRTRLPSALGAQPLPTQRAITVVHLPRLESVPLVAAVALKQATTADQTVTPVAAAAELQLVSSQTVLHPELVVLEQAAKEPLAVTLPPLEPPAILALLPVVAVEVEQRLT